MYGMVNKAARQLIIDKFGADTWKRVVAKAGMDDSTFIAIQQYPDAVTYDLVAAASEVLELQPEAVLLTFGEYWITYAQSQGYGALLDSLGDDFFDALEQLDQLHVRLSLSFPEYRPPSFSCSERTPDQLLLHYVSEREGLAPFVVGLLQGLAGKLGTRVRVEQVESKGNGHDHDVFRIVRGK